MSLWQWLVLEILLRRTRAETVEKIFLNFITKYFKPKVVLQTGKLELHNDLRYLGLYKQRQNALRLVAEKILSNFDGTIPTDQCLLSTIPHIGRYISNAVLCFGDNQRRPIVDSNIARVLARFHGMHAPKDVRENWIWQLAERMLPRKNYQEQNYGLIDIGSTTCRNQKPICSLCCLDDVCFFHNKETPCM